MKSVCFEMAMYFDDKIKKRNELKEAIPNHGKRWTSEEDELVLKEYKNGKTVKEISEIVQRSTTSINTRLIQLLNLGQ